MPTADHNLEPNTTIATLHIGLGNNIKSLAEAKEQEEERIQFVKDYLKGNPNAPSGATIGKGRGLYFPDDSEDLDEPLITIEIWVDSHAELEAVRGIKEGLEEGFGHDCVCLKVEDVYMEH